MAFTSDVIIIGGGLAGLTAALHLHKAGLKVIVVEKNTYPQHKVCGEYISNEVLPYLDFLAVDIEVLKPTHIDQLHLISSSGKGIKTPLPLGGFGISRYHLDHHLYQLLIERGNVVYHDQVVDVNFTADSFTVQTANGLCIASKQVLGAYGKRANLDFKLNRTFTKKKAPFLAIKAHYTGYFEDNVVALYSFKGGYCGISKVETDQINICYLADYETFKSYKNINNYQKEVLGKNQALNRILENSKMLFDAPITISQLSFGTKTAISNHILMIGDAVGLIHPLCGNGMAMAIHSAKIASELLISFFNGEILTRAELEKKYTKKWSKLFNSRLKMGSILAYLLQKDWITDFLLSSLTKMPFLLKHIIKRTHGKPLTNEMD